MPKCILDYTVCTVLQFIEIRHSATGVYVTIEISCFWLEIKGRLGDPGKKKTRFGQTTF